MVTLNLTLPRFGGQSFCIGAVRPARQRSKTSYRITTGPAISVSPPSSWTTSPSTSSLFTCHARAGLRRARHTFGSTGRIFSPRSAIPIRPGGKTTHARGTDTFRRSGRGSQLASRFAVRAADTAFCSAHCCSAPAATRQRRTSFPSVSSTSLQTSTPGRSARARRGVDERERSLNHRLDRSFYPVAPLLPRRNCAFTAGHRGTNILSLLVRSES